MLNLQESLIYAGKDNLVVANVEYLDDNWGTDYIEIGKIIK